MGGKWGEGVGSLRWDMGNRGGSCGWELGSGGIFCGWDVKRRGRELCVGGGKEGEGFVGGMWGGGEIWWRKVGTREGCCG